MKHSRSIKNTAVPACFAAFAVALPAVLIRFSLIDAYTAQIITLAGINALMALSVNIVCGITGQLSLGQAGFMAIGAYSALLLTESAHVPLALSVLASGIITSCAGFVIGFPTLKLTGDYLAIVTLGFGEIIRVLLVNFKELTGGASGKRFTDSAAVWLSLTPYAAWVFIIGTLVITIVLLHNFIRSTYGRAVLAVREDEIAAASSGVGVFRYKMTGFVIASFVAGIAGALYAPFIGFIKPDLASFNRSIDYLIFVVLGGMGSITGSVLSAFVLSYMQEFLRFLKDFRLLIYPLILILVMLFRPQGLLGIKELSFVALWDKLCAAFCTAVRLQKCRLRRCRMRAVKQVKPVKQNEADDGK